MNFQQFTELRNEFISELSKLERIIQENMNELDELNPQAQDIFRTEFQELLNYINSERSWIFFTLHGTQRTQKNMNYKIKIMSNLVSKVDNRLKDIITRLTHYNSSEVARYDPHLQGNIDYIPEQEEEVQLGEGRNPYSLLHQKGHEGKFTAQFKARKPHLRHLLTLEEFAHYILAHPTEFNKITRQRSHFYKNLIAPKIGGLTPKMMDDLRKYHRQVGGKISAKDFELMLQESYKTPDKRDKHIGDYYIDESLSTPENVVYHNPKTGETKVAYRGTEGTLKDWGNNALYAFGLHNTSKRYKRANETQKKVEQKYGTNQLDVLGHSQSGAFSQEIGKNAKNTIVLNPASHPFYSPKAKNTTVVRSKGDSVSALKYLNPLNWGKKADIEIEAKTYNPVTEHMPSVLERLPEDTILGNGRKRKRNKKLRRLCNCGMCAYCR